MGTEQLKERLMLKKNYDISARDLICGTARMFYSMWSNPQEVRAIENYMEKTYGGSDRIESGKVLLKNLMKKEENQVMP
jgi:hypothetical protein